MRPAILMSLPLFAACAAPPAEHPEDTVRPGEEFALALGEAADLAGHVVSLKFRRVIEDSRCPKDVQCVWEGNARIEVLIRERAFDPNRKAVETTDSVIELNTSARFPTKQPFARWSIELRRLEPDAPGGAQPAAYRATLLMAETR